MTMLKDLSDLNDKELFKQSALIGANWCDADNKSTIEVINPATGDVLGSVPDCTELDTLKAIEIAEKAFSKWRKVPSGERAHRLECWFGLMKKHEDDLALLLSLEQGKPLAEAKGEIAYGSSFIKWFAEETRRADGTIIPAPAGDRQILATKAPVGVCAIITPWNFPNAMITRKVGPALAAGCTVVIKPSDLTPYSALALGVLAQRAGIPDGVINIVTGMPAEIGKVLTSSPVIRKLSFTGSTRVGSLLMEQCAPTVKRLSLELGGNAPFIVFDDANLDAAIDGVIASKFRNGGQTCVCSNRILVQTGIYDQFAKRLAEKVQAMKVGPGTEEGTDIGPMINQAAIDKIDRHIADALKKGANIIAQAVTPNSGQYASPTVLSNCNADMVLASEETFGPVAPLFRFESEEEAIAIANATPFGLAAYFFTENTHRTWRVSEALDFGMVGINTGNVSMTVSPFGGVKLSGLGREGGKLGLDEYLETKTLHIAQL